MSQNHAIVIGVGPDRGLGAQLCRRFAAEGLHVLVAGRTRENLDAVVESLGEEAAVKRQVADYLSQLPGVGEDGEETEAESLTREKLQGCAEVWGMEPFIDRDLFNTLANAGK